MSVHSFLTSLMDINLDIYMDQSGVILLVGWSHTHVATGLTHAG